MRRPASLVRVGSNGRDSIYESSHDVVPRVGVVWDPFKDGKTSVRGAFAIAIDQPVTNVVTPTTANPPLAVPVAFGGAVRLDSAITTALASGLAPASVNPDFKGGRMQNWNVNVERQIGSAMGVMVGYFGSKGDRLRISRNINQFVNGVRPYPRLSATSPILPGASLGNITEVGSFGESHYHGLWISANQRLSRGLQFNASYTLSKSTDYNSLSSQGVVVQDSFNLADSEGPSDFDARHRFVINAIYELPFTGNWLKEGWQIGVIVQAQSGNPISIVTAINTFTGVANTLRPDLVGDPAIAGTPDKWFENSVCDPRISGSCDAGFRVRPAGLADRRVPLRQSRAQRDSRPRLQQHRLVAHQEHEGRADPAAAARRGVQPVQSRQFRPTRAHRRRGQHGVWRDHEHPLPDRRLRLGAADSVRDQGALLIVCRAVAPWTARSTCLAVGWLGSLCAPGPRGASRNAPTRPPKIDLSAAERPTPCAGSMILRASHCLRVSVIDEY